MIQSGLIQTDSRLNNVTGVLAELPFFDQLDYTEESVDSSAMVGAKVTATTKPKPTAPALSTVQL